MYVPSSLPRTISGLVALPFRDWLLRGHGIIGQVLIVANYVRAE